jgi:hypothetical protein
MVFWEGIHGTSKHRRVMSRIAPEEIERCFMNWVRAVLYRIMRGGN